MAARRAGSAGGGDRGTPKVSPAGLAAQAALDRVENRLAVVVAALSNYLTAITPEYWQLVVGIIFVLVVVAAKGGVAGAIERALRRRASEWEHG